MRNIVRACVVGGLLSVVAGLVGSCQSGASRSTEAEAFFQREVRPILEMNCLPCHNGVVLPGRLDLTTREKALASRLHGRAFIVPGRPDDSLLVTAVSRQGTHPKLMPQRDLSLTEEDIGTLREWITDGAAWPDGRNGLLRAKPNPEAPRPGA
jgi:hypothetical protein